MGITGSYDDTNPEDSGCTELGNLHSNLELNNSRTNFPRNEEHLSPPEQGIPSNPTAPVLRTQLSGSDSMTASDAMTGSISGRLNENSSSYDSLQNLLTSSRSGTKHGPDSLI